MIISSPFVSETTFHCSSCHREGVVKSAHFFRGLFWNVTHCPYCGSQLWTPDTSCLTDAAYGKDK